MRKYCLRGVISRDIAEKALELIANSEIRLHEVDLNFALKILRMSLEWDVTVYDAAYIALASSLGVAMYTADDRLLNNQKVSELKIVKHIKEYQR